MSSMSSIRVLSTKKETLQVENAALKKELRMIKNQRNIYLKELQRKTGLLKRVE